MLTTNNMIARFTDANILKALLDHDNGDIVITMLDGNGVEVDYTIDTTPPAHMTFKIINNSSEDIIVKEPYYDTYGLQLYYYDLSVGETMEIPSGYGTPDGNTYVTALMVVADNVTAVNTNLVNCVIYGGYYAIIDPTENASCTVTINDL